MDEKPLETTPVLPPPDAPLQEVFAFFDAHPELIKPEYMNNFHLLVPGGDMRKTFMDIPRVYEKRKPLYDAFDAALSEAGIDSSEVEKLAEKINSASRNRQIIKFSELVQQMHELTLPVYGILRKKGYSTAQLIG
jgi:hypothetical protein